MLRLKPVMDWGASAEAMLAFAKSATGLVRLPSPGASKKGGLRGLRLSVGGSLTGLMRMIPLTVPVLAPPEPRFAPSLRLILRTRVGAFPPSVGSDELLEN